MRIFTWGSQLGIRVIVNVFQSLKVSNKNEIQTEWLEIHNSISLVFFPEVPEKVDRILSTLFAHQEMDVTNDGEGEPGGGKGEEAPYLGQIMHYVEH